MIAPTSYQAPRQGQPRRSLVTGGAGFIGQHLVSALRMRGDFVRVLDVARPSRFTGAVPNEFIEGSVTDPEAARHAMQGIDCVYHLAAISHLWTRDRTAYERVNHIGTRTILAAAGERRVQRVVHCSTDAVLLCEPGGAEADESSRAATLSDMAGPYTRSKFLAEEAAMAAARNGMSLTIVSPTVPVGPGDYNVTPPTAMLASFIKRPPRFVLDCNLNLVDVRDVAQGILLAGERGRAGARYVLGGENIKLQDLVARIAAAVGCMSANLRIPGSLALAVGRISEWVADNITHDDPLATAEGVRLALCSAPLHSHKAQEELGYAPRPLGRSLPEAIAWISGHLGQEHAPQGRPRTARRATAFDANR